jgi:bifunctional ADP-heptose synthase (sugar kinase/adenylyltransferase)
MDFSGDFSGATILTLGDVMLDHSAHCRFEQILPVAPAEVG